MIDKDYDWGASLTIKRPKGFKTRQEIFSEMIEVSQAVAQRCVDDFAYDFVMKCTPKEIEELKEILKSKGSD